jgi:pilus assembly protein CpaE
MTHILVIDDEPMFHRLVAHALEPLGCSFDTAVDGSSGINKAHENPPDVIICDVMMPDISGYEVTRQLRREAAFASTPVLILTSQAEMQDRIKAFEAGADDHIAKPFNPEELVQRVSVLLHHAEALKSKPARHPVGSAKARIIAIHSLRGGAGCSSLAVNLATSLRDLWQAPTLLMDLALLAGQVALMLNTPLRRTWSDLVVCTPQDLDLEILNSIISLSTSGLEFIAAPASPSEAEMVSCEMLAAALELAREQYDYIIVDLPHDFGELTLQVLDEAEIILSILTPEMASLRAAVATLDTYQALKYPPERVRLVLNTTFPSTGIQREKIEEAMGLKLTIGLPYEPDIFVQAINAGQPLVSSDPSNVASGLIEDLAYYLSKDVHKKSQPANPTPGLKRVYKRYAERKKVRSA